MKYDEFLKSKVAMATTDGFDVDQSQINGALKPHCKAIVPWLLKGGRRALFASFGLHKTVIQLETVRLAAEYCNGRGLIVLPLGVRQEFRRDAVERLGWKEAPRFIRRIEEADATGVYLTNYETVRDGKLNPQLFDAASLDEASVLRGFGGTKTFREFMALFAGDRKTMNTRERTQGLRYRFVATATPSPNDYIELLAYAAFLGVMDVGQAKTRFFKRDSTKADQLTIHPHKEREFWLWVASWAMFINKPSDLGFDDTGYSLPPLDVVWHEVGSNHLDAGADKSGQGRMFRNAAIGVSEAANEKRESMAARIGKLTEIINVEKGKQTGLQQSVLQEQSGKADSRTEGARQEGRPGGEAQVSARVLSEKPGTLTGTPEGQESRALSEGEGRTGSKGQGPEINIGEVRPDATNLPGHAGCAGRRVRDLHGKPKDSTNGSRSLPQHGEGARDSLHPMQHRDWAAGGQPGSDTRGCGLPDQLIIWCDLNDEQRAIERALTEHSITYSSLLGSQDIELRDSLMVNWKEKRTAAFVSKPTMYGAGVNLQQCHTMVFVGIGFKFADFIQAIHRIQRFQQQHRCTVHIIYTEAERDIRKALERKWSQHNNMVQKMTDIVKQYGLNHASMAAELTRAIGVERIEVSGDGYTCINNDSVKELPRHADNSVGLILTSVPFSTQYEYSPNYSDFGHNDNNEKFFEQMDFLTPELFRVLQPGRIAAIHVKDRIVPGGLTGLGFQTVYPFHARCIEHYTKHGFGYMGMKTIVTDVVRENNQTYRLGWTEQCKDGTKMGVGMPEYLLLFRKPPTDTTNSYADNPVVKSKAHYSRSRWQIDAHGFTRSSGERLLTPDELKGLPHDTIFQMFKDYSLTEVYNFEHHVKIGETLEAEGMLPVTFMLLQPQSPHVGDVWTDVTRMQTLNGAQSAKGREMHLCPMQFDIADRVIAQFTMPGETVLDPFGGLMTVPYRAIKAGRKGIGIELSPQYFTDGVSYCESMAREIAMPTLFDTVPQMKEAA